MRLAPFYLLAALLASGPTQASAPNVKLPAPARSASSQVWPGTNAYIRRLQNEILGSARSGHSSTLARLHRLENFTRFEPAPEALEIGTLAVIDAKRTSGLAKDHARYILAQRRRGQGRPQEEASLLAQLGMVRDGLILGPFDNPAGAGHSTALAPETAPSPSEVMNAQGEASRWRSFSGLAPHGTIELSQFLTPASEATAYVAVGVRVPRATQAALRVGATDAVKAWANSDLVLDNDTRRFAALDQESVGITLRRGLNLILVKVSWSQDTGQLLLRITNPKGGQIKNLEFDTSPESLAEAWPERGFTGSIIKTRKVHTVLDGLNTDESPEGLALDADLLAVLGLYDQRKRPRPPQQLLMRAVAQDPADPNLRFMLAHRTRSVDASRARAQFNAALFADPGYAPAHLGLGSLAREAGRLIDARTHLDAAVTADPTSGAAHIARASLGFEMLDEGGVALSRLNQAWSSTPSLRKHFPLQMQLARMQESLTDGQASQVHAKSILQGNPNHRSARSMAIRLAIDSRQYGAAAQLLAAEIADRPHILGARLRYARLLAGQPHGLSAALEVLSTAGQDFNRAPEVWALRADMHISAAQEDEAVEALTQAQDRAPHNPDYRRRLHQLRPAADGSPGQGSVDAVALSKTPVTAQEKRYGATYLADIKTIRRLSNGKSTRTQQFVVRLHNSQLEEALKAQRIYYSPSRETVRILAAQRIRANGEIVPASQILDEGPSGKVSGMYVDQRFKLVLFDDLEAGDAVHIRYRVDAIGADILGGFFGDITPVQSYLPKESFVYEVITPADQPLYQGTLKVAPAEPSTIDGETTLAWHLTDIPALDSEPLGPPYTAVAQFISVSSYADWDALGQWYGPLFSEQMVLDDAARTAGRTALKGATDPAEKVRRLYDYVVKNTRYVGIELGVHGWKPFKASEVHRRRYGDCKDKATLLSALLRDNGVDATLTLVRTADRGPVPANHATMWAFNHAITYVPELDLFLDPTAEFNGSSELPTADQGAVGLIVYPDGRTKRVTLPISDSKQNTNASTYQAEIARTSQLKLQGTETFTGAPAAEVRRFLQEPEQRIRRIEEPLAQIFPGVKVTRADFSDLDNFEREVSYSYDIEVPSYGRRDTDSLSVAVALFQHQVTAAYAQLPVRGSAIHITHAWQTQNIVRYLLPKGSKVTTLPEGLSIDTPHISLQQIIRPVDGGFETNDTVTLKSRVIPPQDYQEFRKACLAIDRAMARKVVIRW